MMIIIIAVMFIRLFLLTDFIFLSITVVFIIHKQADAIVNSS